MGREYKAGQEPVPGYRLAKFIGRGGFGEVWRAVGPGGTEVALKIIALDRKQGMKEFKSLRLVKRIHHPNLVPILAFWLVDAEGVPLDDESIDLLGSNLLDSRQPSTATATMQFNAARAEQLIIAMGLGEKNLLDVLKEYQAKGLAGIPLEELLDFMEGSARAIDFLNTPRHNLGGADPVAIQHCDIKPQNIMLVGDAVQVCDFGLARSLSDVRSTSVAASIAYGAPELFWENKPTRATDQYSLAITYYELRTGHLPFGADSAAIEVMQAHRDGKLDLHHLNDAERAVVKRATDPSPSGRFERTIDMVRALRRAAHGGERAFEGPSRTSSVGMRSSFIHTGREIVAGCTLLEHLFHPDARTDVWSCSAPGGSPQAMWLYEVTAGAVDREALKLIQETTDQSRLARLAGWWLLDAAGQDVTNETGDGAAQATTLAIASELTRTNLAHRVEECRQFRGKGIPLDELLGYMQQVAEGVDALNEAALGSRRVSLVHTDLRPANLLVFGNAVKIGNFAWCRTLEGEEAELAGMPARTPRPTMPPELAAGRINRRTDQYSLAASYVQMRTGNLLLESGLPSGSASGALAGSSLDLSSLSEAESEVVRRAMHADPHERYASCRKLVAELALAAKKVPVGAAEAAMPVSRPAAAAFGSHTMMPGDLLSTRSTSPPSVTPLINTGDTKPDVRGTVEEPGVQPPHRRPRRTALIATAALILAAAAAGVLTGKQTEAEVAQRIEAGEYKAAIDAIPSPFWRHWRSDPGVLRDRVVSSARDKAINAAEEGEVGRALDIQAQLKDVLTGTERDDFRLHVFGKAIDYATENFKDDRYKDAHGIYARLHVIAPDDFRVVELGKSLWQHWAERIAPLAEHENFSRAIDIFQQLDSLGDDERIPGEDSNILDVKTQIIAAGIKTITEAKDQQQTVKALDAAEQFRQVKAFANETRLSQAINDLVVRAIGGAEADLENRRIEGAKAVHERLARLARTNTDVRHLSQQILDHELRKAGSRLADENWEAALAEYVRVRKEWPKEDESAKDAFDRLEGDIVRLGERDFQKRLNDKKAGDVNRAKEICDLLAGSFPDNDIVKAMQDDVKVAMSGEGQGAVLAPEQLVARLLTQAEQNIRLRVLDDAAKNLADAEEKIEAELPARDDLRRRASLDHAYLSWEKKDWPDAETWLNQVKASDFAGASSESQLTRYYLLRTLVPAHYDGGALAEGADLDSLSRAVDELRHADAKWEESTDRLLANGAKELCRELGLQVAGLIGSTEPKQRSLGKLLRDRIDKTYWPDNVETLIAVNNTIALLNTPDTASRDIQKSLDAPDFTRGPLPDTVLPRLAEAFARWGRESKEPDAAANAIAWIRSLKQTDDVRRASVGLGVAELVRAASLPEIDWKQLAARCRSVNEDLVAAGATEHAGFVRTCLAESLAETALAASSPVPIEAQTELDVALRSTIAAEDRPYVDYVTFRIGQALGRTIGGKDRAALADGLCEAIKSSAILANPWRRARTAELLSGAARGLAGVDSSDDPLAPPSFGDNKENAEQAYRWLTTAQGLADATGKKLGDESRLLLAVAAEEKKEPDHPLANSLLDELSKGPAPAPKVMLISARSLEKNAPQEAVRRYAEALQAILKLGTASDEAMYDRIVSPAMRVVESLDEKQRAAVASQAALLYANKGRLIRLDAAVESKVCDETKTPGADAIYEAYDKAIQLDPNVPDFYVQRGTGRYSTTTRHNSLEALKRDDIAHARDLLGGKETPGLYGLTGVANLLEARAAEPMDRAGRVDFYKKAAADAAKAVDAADPKSDDYPQFLLLHSISCLELANFATDSDQAIRGYLDNAVASARKAIADGRGAHPEFAYQALGNAEEDYGLLLKDYDGYRRSLQAFDDSRLKALENLAPPDEALICLGRVRYRLATCGAEPAAAGEVLLSSGLADLQAAIDSNRVAEARVAEAYWWQSQIHSARANPSERAAASEALQQCLRRVAKNSPAWPVYQLYWAGLAGTVDERRARARMVLDLPTSKADPSRRAQAISIVAASYQKAGATPEQVRQQLEQGFAEYQRYLPWLPDPSKATSTDVPALLELSEHILLDRAFWRSKADLCKASSERALALADELHAADLAARARADLGNHALYVATSQSALDLAALRKSADHFRAAVDFDDKLATAQVTALDRQSIRSSLAPKWRYALARVDGSLATDSRTSAADRKALRDEAIKTLDNARDLPEDYKNLFKDYRKKLRAI